MSYVSKEFRDKIINYYKDLDYCYRHYFKVYYNRDSYPKEFVLNKERQLIYMYELFLGLLESL